MKRIDPGPVVSWKNAFFPFWCCNRRAVCDAITARMFSSRWRCWIGLRRRCRNDRVNLLTNPVPGPALH